MDRRLSVWLVLLLAAAGARPASPQSVPGGGSRLVGGEIRRSQADGLEYAWIPAGTFQMGCVEGDSECADDEKPRHEVTITKGFWMGRTEVTVAAYERFAGAPGRVMPPAPAFNARWELKDHPIVNVTWEAARDYCQWAGGRLPTEAEWEYAARGGKEGLKHPWGNELDHERANYGKDECCGGLARGRDGWENTSPVGSFEPNSFGLYDVTGNVREWVTDRYDMAYKVKRTNRNPRGPRSGPYRVLRGGSWSGVPGGLRVSYRASFEPGGRDMDFGFRCVRKASSL